MLLTFHFFVSDRRNHRPVDPSFDWAPWLLPSSTTGVVLNSEGEKGEVDVEEYLPEALEKNLAEVSHELLNEILSEWKVGL
jgi:hypothetical protein